MLRCVPDSMINNITSKDGKFNVRNQVIDSIVHAGFQIDRCVALVITKNASRARGHSWRILLNISTAASVRTKLFKCQ